MKKILAIIFTFGLILTLSACDLDLDDLVENNPPTANGVSSETVLGEESKIPDSTTSSQIVSDTNTTISNASSGNGIIDNNSQTVIPGGCISREKAIEIALNHAGLKQNEVINLTAEFDRDDTHNEWEVEFDKDNYEYSYEINADTSEIIKSEKEIDD